MTVYEKGLFSDIIQAKTDCPVMAKAKMSKPIDTEARDRVKPEVQVGNGTEKF